MDNVKSNVVLAAVFAACMPIVALAADKPHVPEYLRSAVVYQISLRTFTRDGNFRAATEMLEHVRSVGVDVVYLTPFVEMDRDMDETGWSPRQKKSGFHTPKNPYSRTTTRSTLNTAATPTSRRSTTRRMRLG